MPFLDSVSLPVLVVAILAASNCALVGSYLVLRRVALLGDAISHGVLPGLVVGFILAGSRDLLPMVIGALLAAFVTTLMIDLLRRRFRIDGDAAMGVVFTTLFALGVILIERYAAQVDLDPGCVLYGQVEFSALDRWSGGTIFGWAPPRHAISLGVVLLANIALVAIFWKELKLSSFDPDLGDALGISSNAMHFLLMGMTAVTTVAAFEAVGSILVVSMLVVPGVIGHLISDRLIGVLIWAQVSGVLAAGLGLAGAEYYETSVAGMMAVAGGGIFLGAFILAPRHGSLPRQVRRLGLAVRIAEEDILGGVYRRWERRQAGEDVPEPGTEPARQPGWQRMLAWWRLRLGGYVDRMSPDTALTRRGRIRGLRLVRRHRLWETYLEARLALPSSHLHDPAHRVEHFIDEALARRLEEKLEHPERDPHGRSIPSPEE